MRGEARAAPQRPRDRKVGGVMEDDGGGVRVFSCVLRGAAGDPRGLLLLVVALLISPAGSQEGPVSALFQGTGKDFLIACPCNTYRYP